MEPGDTPISPVDWLRVDSDFRDDLSSLLNRYSRENNSNTPDFLLSQYLSACLAAFDRAVAQRDSWYGIHPKPGA